MFEDFTSNGTRERRAKCLLAFVFAMFGVLGIRLYSLQIGDWERYRIQSEKNTMQPVPLEASRGLIRDRNGRILVENRPSYTISVVPPRFLQGLQADARALGIHRLSRLVNLPEALVERRHGGVGALARGVLFPARRAIDVQRVVPFHFRPQRLLP